MIKDSSEWKVEAQESKASISYFSFILKPGNDYNLANKSLLY